MRLTKSTLCLCFTLAYFVLIGILIVAIIGLFEWRKSMPTIAKFDLDKINSYGQKHPNCDTVASVGFVFNKYLMFSCNKCPDVCFGDEIKSPSQYLLTHDHINCVLISVHKNKNITNVYFDQCYHYKNIDWDDLESDIPTTESNSIWICAWVVISLIWIACMRWTINYNCYRYRTYTDDNNQSIPLLPK